MIPALVVIVSQSCQTFDPFSACGSMTPLIILLSVFAGLAGALIGALLGLNGFAQPATASALGQAPRIKNLLWLFSGLFPVFVADTHKLGIPEDFPLYWPAVVYGITALAAAVASVIWMACSITASAKEFNRQHLLAAPVDAGDLVREYLTYGKTRFETRWEELKAAALITETNAAAVRERVEREQTAAAERRRLDQQAIEERRRLDIEADKLTAQCVTAAIRHAVLPTADRLEKKEELLDSIIEAITGVVQLHAGTPIDIRCSYMAFVPAIDSGPELHQQAMFTSGMLCQYAGYLELRHGSGPAFRESVILPVAKTQEHVLPGAPEALSIKGASVLDLGRLTFRDGVSEAAKQEVISYFKDPYFATIRSITSVAVLDRGRLHGVVNVETSAANLVGKNSAAAQHLIGRLQIVIVLLSMVR